MDQSVQNIVHDLQGLLFKMTPEERLEVFSATTEGWCVNCGGPSPNEWNPHGCQCMNDE